MSGCPVRDVYIQSFHALTVATADKNALRFTRALAEAVANLFRPRSASDIQAALALPLEIEQQDIALTFLRNVASGAQSPDPWSFGAQICATVSPAPRPVGPSGLLGRTATSSGSTRLEAQTHGFSRLWKGCKDFSGPPHVRARAYVRTRERVYLSFHLFHFLIPSILHRQKPQKSAVSQIENWKDPR